MGSISPKHYVYVIVSLRGLYIGKGSGERIRESMNERRGIVCFKVRRCFTSSGAYRAESRLIRCCRRTGIPLQNGRAPGRWFRLKQRRREKHSLRDRLVGSIVLIGGAWWLLS
jgi:hypothetical protein